MRHGQFTGLTACFNSGAVALDAGATTYDIVTAIDYAIDGRAYNKATVSNGATPTEDVNTGEGFVALGADKACMLLWLLDADGTVAVAQSEVIDIDGDTDLLKGQGHLWPKVPDGYVPFAYTLHQRDSTGAAWTPGTSNWDATGLTDVVVNLAQIPYRPPTDTVS